MMTVQTAVIIAITTVATTAVKIQILIFKAPSGAFFFLTMMIDYE